MKVAITQPYVPQYREALLGGVVTVLERHDVQARVFFGGSKRQLQLRASRADGTEQPWAEQVPVRTIRLGRITSNLQFRVLPREWRAPDLLVTELQAGNANAWHSKATGAPYILLGHGKSYTASSRRGADRLESYLNRGAAHVLTYMPSGRDHVLQDPAVDPNRVTAFMNTTDTAALSAHISRLTAADDARFRERHGIRSDARVALYIGALAAYKKIDLLCAAAGLVLADPSTHLLVAGAGTELHRLTALKESHGRVTLLGHCGPADLAAAARVSSLILNPGRIGLIAVDALTMQLPLLSTRFPFHAPEAEYLVEGVDVFYTADDPAAFAQGWLSLVARAGHSSTTPRPSTEQSVKVIAESILTALPRPGGGEH